jgi:hypothetical protein
MKSLTCLSFLCAGMRPARHSLCMHIWLAKHRFIPHLFGGGRLHDDLLLVHHRWCLCRLWWRYIIIIHLEQNHNSIMYMHNLYVTWNLILKVTVLCNVTSQSGSYLLTFRRNMLLHHLGQSVWSGYTGKLPRSVERKRRQNLVWANWNGEYWFVAYFMILSVSQTMSVECHDDQE